MNRKSDFKKYTIYMCKMTYARLLICIFDMLHGNSSSYNFTKLLITCALDKLFSFTYKNGMGKDTIRYTQCDGGDYDDGNR